MTTRLDQLADRVEEWSWVEELAALHALQAQALLDMVMRLAAELGYRPTSPREADRSLVAEGLLNPHEADLVRRVAGFRNIVVDEYTTVNTELVKTIVQGREYHKVAALAARLLERAEARSLDP